MNYISETVLRDIVDIMSEVKDFDTIDAYISRLRKNRSMSSIASGSNSLTLEFPCALTNGLSLVAMETINRANELKAVEMLQLLFASMQMANSAQMQDYLTTFHTNINTKLTMDNVLSTVDRIIDLGESSKINRGLYIDPTEIELICKTDLQKINKSTLNQYIPESLSVYRIKEYHNEFDIIKESMNVPNNSKNRKDYIDTLQKSIPSVVSQRDIDKQNNLVGTQLLVTVNYMNGEESIPISFMCVVKSKLYVLQSEDIINKIVTKNKDKNFLNSLIKVSTGETAFFRDFVFAIDKAKLDAISHSELNKTSAKLFKVLERRSLKSKILRSMNAKNTATAITTLGITREEADYILRYYNIDITKSSIARQIMEAYNLLCFIIADEVNEMAMFLYDTGDDEFETISFAGLEKESREGPYRKSLQLMVTSNK